MVINLVTTSSNVDAADITDDKNLGLALRANVCVLINCARQGFQGQ